eukprot:6175306-Pleurochrysis_carterae.AAC.3
MYTIELGAVGERARARGLDAPAGWLRGIVALSGCVGQARCGISELEERSASAPQVRMQRECKPPGNFACGPKGAARCDGFEQSTRNEGKTIKIRLKTKQ